MTVPTFRFAPTPNGPLHLGHALSAAVNFEFARRAGARFLSCINDIDATRCRAEFEAEIYRDLTWLGLVWQQPVRRQSEHSKGYAAALGRLDAMGLVYPSFESPADIVRLVAAREAAGPWPRDPRWRSALSPRRQALPQAERRRLMASGRPYMRRLDMAAALTRLDMAAALARLAGEATAPLVFTETGPRAGTIVADPAACGDVAPARKDAPASYHLAVVRSTPVK